MKFIWIIPFLAFLNFTLDSSGIPMSDYQVCFNTRCVGYASSDVFLQLVLRRNDQLLCSFIRISCPQTLCIHGKKIIQ